MDQRFAVMRTGAPHQRAVDIEEYQCAIGQMQSYAATMVLCSAPSSASAWSRWPVRRTPTKTSPKPNGASAKLPARARRSSASRNCSASQYFCREEDPALFDLAEPVPGPTTESFARLARELQVAIIGSVFERRAAGVYHNTAVVIDADGALLGIYRKMHIPDDPGYYEKYYFTPGDLGFPCFDTRFARVAPLVCWDQWYPEAARLAALAGAQVLFYPTAIGWHPAEKSRHGAAEHDAWRTIQRSHAIANGLYVAAVNRVGYEGPPETGLEFWGGSFVADPFGQVLAEASHDREETLIVGVRPAPHRRSPPQLALPSRPAHRRLLGHYQPDDRVGSFTTLRPPQRGTILWGGPLAGVAHALLRAGAPPGPGTRADTLYAAKRREKSRRGTHECVRHSTAPIVKLARMGPLARGRPPSRPARTREEPDQGVRRGRGRPPHVVAYCRVSGWNPGSTCTVLPATT
jgi:N-carbamoylputrescine amidase